MNIQRFLDESTAKLVAAGGETARLDCLVLLEDALGKDRVWVLAHQDHDLARSQQELLIAMIERRIAHEPLAYIRGKTEFYGRDFVVSSSVLVPRPESESLIELLKELPDTASTLVDIGTGSGCLAITAALELSNIIVHASDTSTDALKTAKANAKKHGTRIVFHEASLLPKPFQLSAHTYAYGIITNLPYVPDDYPINTAAQHEPSVALFAGHDGLDLYRELFAQIDQVANKPEYIITESLPSQQQALTKIATDAGYKLENTADFGQCFTQMAS